MKILGCWKDMVAVAKYNEKVIRKLREEVYALSVENRLLKSENACLKAGKAADTT